MTVEDRNTRIALWLMILAGAFIRVYGLFDWDYFYDEIWHTYVSQQRTLAGVFHTNLIRDGHPPISYLLQRLCLAFWDDSFAARIPSLIAGILTIPVFYFLGKEMSGTRGGALFTAFFGAFSCLLVTQSDVIRGYSLCLLFAAITLWSLMAYLHHPKPLYLGTYYAGLALALLSEWSAMVLAPCTGLLLLHNLYKRRQTKSFIVCVLVHLILLIYLAWFQHALSTIGMLKWTSREGVHKIAHTFKWQAIFFNQFMLESSPLDNLMLAPNHSVFRAITALVYNVLMFQGLIRIIYRRPVPVAVLAIILIITMVQSILMVIGIIPYEFPRRSICYVFVPLMLYYYALAPLYRYTRPERFPLADPAYIAIIATLVMSAAYGVYGKEWRKYNPLEFQQTKAQTQTIFSFLDEHLKPNDIILTNWASSLYLWNTTGKCDYVTLSDQVLYYPCYKVPVYVPNTDERVVASKITLRRAQDMFADLERLHKLNNIGNWWIAVFQFSNVYAPSPGDSWFIADILKNPKMFEGHFIPYTDELKKIKHDNLEFLHFLYDSSHPQIVEFSDGCQEEGELFKKSQQCVMRVEIVGLPASAIGPWFTHHNQYNYLDAIPNDL